MEQEIKEPKKINKKSILPIVFYVVAGLIAIYSLFTIYTSYTYITSLVDAGSINVTEQLSDVVNYYVSSSMPYIFYSISIWSIGYVISKLNEIKEAINTKVQ